MLTVLMPKVLVIGVLVPRMLESGVIVPRVLVPGVFVNLISEDVYIRGSANSPCEFAG